MTSPAAEQQSGAGGLARGQDEGHGEGLGKSEIDLTWTGKLPCRAISYLKPHGPPYPPLFHICANFAQNPGGGAPP